MAKNLASAATSQAPCSSAHAHVQALEVSCSKSFIATRCSIQETLWQCFRQSLQNLSAPYGKCASCVQQCNAKEHASMTF